MIVALETIIFRLHATEVTNIKDAIIPATTSLSTRKSPYIPTNDDKLRVVQSSRVLSVYHILFIVAQLFQLILLCDAVGYLFGEHNIVCIFLLFSFTWR